MTDEELRQNLAGLIVEALEVGTGKHERDVIHEIFDAFNIDFNDLDARIPQKLPGRTRLLRQRAANRLADAAPTAAALLNEVVRCGGRFIAMLDEVYVRLSQHTATTAGTSETFRLERGGVNEQQLTISPAFIEQVRRLERSVRAIEIGELDEEAIDSFLGWDNRFYGGWPPDADYEHKAPLADSLLSLNWVTSAVRDRASGDARWAQTGRVVDAARASAERLVDAAKRLVRTRMAHLDMLSDLDTQTASGLLSSTEPERWRRDRAMSELERFRTDRVLTLIVSSRTLPDVGDMGAVGLRSDLEPVLLPADEHGAGTSLSTLAGFIAMWSLGLWPELTRGRIDDLLGLGPAALASWLDQVRIWCDQAAAWLTNDVFAATGSVDVMTLLEVVKEFLNLPLWRQRHLLYEVWVLCATLDACEQASWGVELNGLTHANATWTLSVGPSRNPVATLRYRPNPTISLDVWREPSRTTSSGVLTPDLTVATPSPYVRDLFVVEAKDRQKMSVGHGQDRQGPPAATSAPRTALGVARRYATGLRPRVTWVCNHSDFRQGIDASINHGDFWTRVYVAGQFRPGHVPAAFTDSVQVALIPPPGSQSADETTSHGKRGLVLVVDVTSSMHRVLNDALAMLAAASASAPYHQFRAVIYSDHGANEPFLVRKVGPFGDLPSLLNSVRAFPRGSGGDNDEALEDAMQRCRELTDDIGPQHLLVLTDAPPHPVGECPYRIDFEAEVRTLLDSGCHVQVANDWLTRHDETWAVFNDLPGFQFAPLKRLIAWSASVTA